MRPTLVRALEITVVAENGHPAAREFVQVFVPGSKPVATGTTDDAGRFVLENPAEGTFAVRAGGDAAGLGTATAVVANGIARVRVDLQRGACVRGRVVRDDSNATSPYRIVWRAEDGSWCDETTTANDGSFVLANLPAIPGDVCAWQDERALALPVAFARHVLTDNGELLLRHDAAHEHRIVLEPVLPDECPDVAIELRVWNVDSGLGAFVPPPKGGSQWTIAGLVPGWYRIEVRAAGCGFVDLGQHWVDGANDIDLGRIVLPRPGRARFVVPEGRAPVDEKARALEIYAVRADLDVRVKPDRDPPWGVDEVPFDRPVFLPAGNYVFAFRHRDGGVRLVRFTCRAGEETLVLAPE